MNDISITSFPSIPFYKSFKRILQRKKNGTEKNRKYQKKKSDRQTFICHKQSPNPDKSIFESVIGFPPKYSQVASPPNIFLNPNVCLHFSPLAISCSLLSLSLPFIYFLFFSSPPFSIWISFPNFESAGKMVAAVNYLPASFSRCVNKFPFVSTMMNGLRRWNANIKVLL